MTIGQWVDPIAGGRDPLEKNPDRIRTKEWWRRHRDHLDPPLPQQLTTSEYRDLSPEGRAAHDLERRRAMSAMPVILTQRLLALDETLAMMLRADEDSAGVKQGLLLTGDSGNGKTTALLHLLRSFELGLMAAHPDYFTRRGNNYVPVAYVTTPSRPGIKPFLTRIARFYGLPLSRNPDASALEDTVMDMIRGCGTTVLVLDDIHNIDVGEAAGRQTNKLLKALAEDSGATIIAVGLDMHNSRIFATSGDSAINVQASSRFTPFWMGPYVIDTPEGIRQWAGLIWAMEQQLPLMNHPDGSLAETQWAYIHTRTGGRIGALSQLLRQSAQTAIATGTERITAAILESTRIDITNQETLHQARKAGSSKNLRLVDPWGSV